MNRPKFAEMMLKDRPGAQPEVPEAASYEKANYRKCPAQKIAMPKGAKAALQATVLIDTEKGYGSGVIISPDGFVLTAAHVVDGEKSVNVIFQDKREAAAKVIRFDRKHDVALLRIKGEGYPCLSVDEVQANVGDKLYAVGSPASKELSFSLSSGIVSAHREWEGVKFLQTDASINPGNSGGPMINETGNVMAVISWKIAGLGVEGVGFGIPCGAALESLSVANSDRSDTALLDAEAAATGPAKSAAVTAYIDVPDSAQSVATTVKTERKKDARKAVKHVLRWSGLALTLGGSALTIITWATAKSRGTEGDLLGLSYDDYERKKTGNTVGWVLAGVGVAAFGTSFVIPNKKSEESEKKPAEAVTPTALSPEWGIGIGAGQATVQVRF
jgi:hypothetical protein